MDEPDTTSEFDLPSPEVLAGAALALGLAFERLVYGRPLGLSYPLWIVLSLAALFGLAKVQSLRTAPQARALTVPLVAGAGLVFLRAEPLTIFMGLTSSLLLMGVLLRSLRTGRVDRWGWLDFGAAAAWVPFEAWLRPWGALASVQRGLTRGEGSKERTAAVLRGVLLAVPILVVFTALLSSADIVFGDRVAQLLEWLDLERLFDLLERGMMIIVVSVFCLGVSVAAFRRNAESGPTLERDLLPRIGLIEPIIVLAALDVLFTLFVSVQFRYFFGGQSAIGVEGYSYAEYARRGFGELVLVSFLSLGLVAGLAAWIRSRHGRGWRVFQGLASALVALTGVILVSALQRLLLYEQAYGFTRLRTYAHVAIVWMAIGFAVFLALLWFSRWQGLAPALAAGVVLYGLSLGVLNVDRFIVRQNFARHARSEELDVDYLLSLSNDAIPELAERAGELDEAARRQVLVELLCRREAMRGRRENAGWPALRWSELRASAALDDLESAFEGYRVSASAGTVSVTPPDGETVVCRGGRDFPD